MTVEWLPADPCTATCCRHQAFLLQPHACLSNHSLITAGLLFAGYASMQIPSTMLCAHFGARRWLSGLMVFWGIVLACTAPIKTKTQFFIMRVLLGCAEAGTFPGTARPAL